MNDAPAGGIYMLSYTPGGYSLIPTPQSGTNRNPKPHTEFPAKAKQTLLKPLMRPVKWSKCIAEIITNTQTVYSQIGFVCFVSHIYFKRIKATLVCEMCESTNTY